MAKELVLIQNENGCITPSSHKLNKDGYFRKNIGRGIWVMYHRHIWEQSHGDIPEGFEIDHLCKNRSCCNVEHLRCIQGSEHAVDTNKTRYADRKQEAFEHWTETQCSGTDLANKFGVTVSGACRWVRSWKV